MTHSLAQELTMLHGMTLEQAEEKVQELQSAVQEQGDCPYTTLEDQEVRPCGRWLLELTGEYED